MVKRNFSQITVIFGYSKVMTVPQIILDHVLKAMVTWGYPHDFGHLLIFVGGSGWGIPNVTVELSMAMTSMVWGHLPP